MKSRAFFALVAMILAIVMASCAPERPPQSIPPSGPTRLEERRIVIGNKTFTITTELFPKADDGNEQFRSRFKYENIPETRVRATTYGIQIPAELAKPPYFWEWRPEGNGEVMAITEFRRIKNGKALLVWEVWKDEILILHEEFSF